VYSILSVTAKLFLEYGLLAALGMQTFFGWYIFTYLWHDLLQWWSRHSLFLYVLSDLCSVLKKNDMNKFEFILWVSSWNDVYGVMSFIIIRGKQPKKERHRGWRRY
jgi:hypothetical protein